MAQERRLSLREAFAQVFHAHGLGIVAHPEMLRADVLALADPNLPETQLLAQELDERVLEPLAYLANEADVVALRYVRLEITEILEEDRAAMSEPSAIVADAIVGGYADSQAIPFGDVQTSEGRARQSDAMRQELARERSQRKAQMRQSVTRLASALGSRLGLATRKVRPKARRNIPWKLIACLALTTCVVAIASVVFVRLSQPSESAVNRPMEEQSLWVVSQCTEDVQIDGGYEYDYDLGDYVLMTTTRHLVTSYVRDANGNVTSLHQEGAGISSDVTFTLDKNGMPQSATDITHVESPYSSDYTGEEEDAANQQATYRYSWAFDDLGRVQRVSMSGVDVGNAAITYAYNSASDIVSRTEERDTTDDEGTVYWKSAIQEYDEHGNLTSYEETNDYSDSYSTQTRYDYDNEYIDDGRLKSSIIRSNDETVAHEEYTYDQNGNLAQRVIVNELEGRRATYTYEYQLVQDPSLWTRQLQHIYPTIDPKLLT